jgi:hypothetical protein
MARSGATTYIKEFYLSTAALGDCNLCYMFKTYWVKDSLNIWFYDEFNSLINNTAYTTGCVATYTDPEIYGSALKIGSGWKEGCVRIPEGTAKILVAIYPGCDENDSRKLHSAWALITSCVCESSQSDISDISDVSFGISSSTAGYSESSSAGYSESSSSVGYSESSSAGYSESSSAGYSESSSAGYSESSSSAVSFMMGP